MAKSGTLNPDSGEGLDRKALRAIRQRFLLVNEGRLQRTRDALPERQQVVLELLPLLLHVNHPLLPGYVSHQTPSGIGRYRPDRDALRAAQKITRSFQYKREPNREPDLHSLFLMGSIGSIGHTVASDLDIWVCYRSNLDPEQVRELETKCQRISKWLAGLGVETHFFPMSPTRFMHGEAGDLSTEDCGSAQHFLLLDEFYRTAVLLAGRYPVWWLTPVEQEKVHERVAANLRDKRYIREDESIDFGGIPRIPAGEFVGAGMWQIYKGIDSPYKAVLKILLTELYAGEYPDVETISMEYKRRVYADQVDLDELDPYVMVYRRLEAFLRTRYEEERLELVRRCLYFKSAQHLSRPISDSHRNWRRQLMERLVAEWGWDEATLRELDDRRNWKVTRVQKERRELVNNLTYSYRFLSQFAREVQSESTINSADMTLLGRKLYAAFERKADKIELINPGIAPDLSEDHLTFGRRGEVWMVWDHALGERDLGSTIPLKRSRNIVELVLWAHLNGLLAKSTAVTVHGGDTHMGLFEMQKLLESLRQQVAYPLPAAPQENFHRQPEQKLLIYYVNVGIDPLTEGDEDGLQRISDRTDALVYSELRENLALSVDEVLLNTWHEVYFRRYGDDDALIEALCDHVQCRLQDHGGPPPVSRVQCFSPSRGASIANRVRELFRDAAACFSGGDTVSAPRYLIDVGKSHYVIQIRDGKPAWSRHASLNELCQYLSEPQPAHSAIILDRYALLNSPLRTVCAAGQAGKIQVFFRRVAASEAEVYILDEHGSLFRYRAPAPSREALLMPLDRFIRSVQYRRRTVGEPGSGEEVTYHEIVFPDGGGPPTLARRYLPQDGAQAEHHAVQAIAEHGSGDEAEFTIFCNHEEFSPLEYGEELFQAVAARILSQRSNRERYPCYITDLDLTGAAGADENPRHYQTVHYLKQKHRLEQALFSALQKA